jgi:hypothetical protein
MYSILLNDMSIFWFSKNHRNDNCTYMKLVKLVLI